MLKSHLKKEKQMLLSSLEKHVLAMTMDINPKFCRHHDVAVS